MKKYVFLIGIIFCNNLNAQFKIEFEKIANSKRTKTIKMDGWIDIKANGCDYFYATIISLNDSIMQIKTNNYPADTVFLKLNEITEIKKDWFKKRNWLEPFGYMAAGSIMGLPLIPVAFIADGKEGGMDCLTGVSIIGGISWTAIFIGTRAKKIDLVHKWKIRKVESL